MIQFMFDIQPFFIFGLMAVCAAIIYIFIRELITWFKNRGNQ